MSASDQQASLARIRENQRRSRARKREYIQELEQRLRECDLQGVQASANVQAAARRVAHENGRLRELLARSGVSSDYINHYVQAGAGEQHDSASQSYHTGTPAPAVQILHDTMAPQAPRRPSNVVNPVVFPLPSQVSREASVASVSTTASPGWHPAQAVVPTPYQYAQPACGPPPVSSLLASSEPPPYSSGLAPTTAQAQVQPFHAPDEPPHQHYPTQHYAVDDTPGVMYSVPAYPYDGRTDRGYGPGL